MGWWRWWWVCSFGLREWLGGPAKEGVAALHVVLGPFFKWVERERTLFGRRERGERFVKFVGEWLWLVPLSLRRIREVEKD